MPPLKNCRIITVAAFIVFTFGCSYHAGAQAISPFDSTLQTILAIKTSSARQNALLDYERKINRTEPAHALVIDSILLVNARSVHDRTAEMNALYRTAVDYNMLNAATSSIDYSFKALEVADELHNNRIIGEIYLNQANIYSIINDTAKEHASIQNAINVGMLHHDTAIQQKSLNELGIFYDRQGQHALAIENLQASITLGFSLRDSMAAANAIINIAIAFKGDKQYAKAQKMFSEGAALADSLHDDYIKAVVIDDMANLEFAMGDYTGCERDAFIAITMSYKVEEKEIRVDIYALLEKLYEKQKRYPEALDYYGKLAALKDSLINEENLAQINEMNQRYQAQLKDKQITAQQSQIANEKKLNLLLGGGGAVVLVIAMLIYFNMRKTAKLNRTVSTQRDALGKQSEKLSVMMKELHHRVKNNLQIVSSLLNLQSLKLTDEEAFNAVQESKQRVQAMALIHQKLYKTEDITRINMKAYITELAGYLAVSYGYNEHNFKLNLSVEDECADIDQALPLALILNELLTNAFKYAFTDGTKAELDILLKRQNQTLTLIVKDNGKGIDPAKWNEKQSNSFGRQLVRALCSQIRAKENIEVNNGTSFIFTIPEAA